jgi:hypothetical protein
MLLAEQIPAQTIEHNNHGAAHPVSFPQIFSVIVPSRLGIENSGPFHERSHLAA